MLRNTDYFEELRMRREFFHDNFPVKIGLQRNDVNSFDVLKNSCPVCGYLTLDERSVYDICLICFWEDDGDDDFESERISGPNHMTLTEGRDLFLKIKEKLLKSDFQSDDIRAVLKNKIVLLDNLILDNRSDEKERILKIQHEILELLRLNEIYGINALFR